MSHILVIEDEGMIRYELKNLLENALYEVTVIENFDRIVEQVVELRPDLVLLDVNLPGMSGFEVCTGLRERVGIPVIFLTGRVDFMDELKGMLGGGDDYITKPYQAPILLARIAAVLKRTRGIQESTRITHKEVTLDISECCLSYHGKCVELTKNEMKILHLLFLHAGKFVERVDLIEFLWENQIFIDDNTLSVHIARVREKLKTLGVFDFIQTKRGIGYRI